MRVGVPTDDVNEIYDVDESMELYGSVPPRGEPSHADGKQYAKKYRLLYL